MSLCIISYSTIVLYIRDHEGLGSSNQNVTLKTTLTYLHDSLATLIRHNEAQKPLHTDSEPFQQVSMEFKIFYFTEFYAD